MSPTDSNALYWQWVKREPGQTDRSRQHIYHQDQPGEALIQKLEQIAFALDEEEDLTIADVTSRVRAAFDVDKSHQKILRAFQERAYCLSGLHHGHPKPYRPRMLRLLDVEPDDVHLLHPKTRLSR